MSGATVKATRREIRRAFGAHAAQEVAVMVAGAQTQLAEAQQLARAVSEELTRLGRHVEAVGREAHGYTNRPGTRWSRLRWLLTGRAW